jgi:type I restriction enzyme S subunit
VSEWQKVKIGDFLHRQKKSVQLDSEQEYALVTIRVKHKGVQLREMKKGAQIGSQMYQIKKGQFILSGIDARQGAFGIVPDELDGAIVTNDFWAFEVDENIVKRDFFYWLTTTPLFLDSCIKSSKGETQRIRLQKDAFYNFEFSFPPIEKQSEFLQQLQIIDSNTSALEKENTNQQNYLTKLRQAILQEAIEGKLTADWRVKNPVQKGNPDHDAQALLETIKAEKQKLIAEGIIKKEKSLAPINPDEVPFALPDGWLWVRLGGITQFIDYRGNTPTKISEGVRLITAKNVKKGYLSLMPDEYISEKEYQQRMTRGYPAINDIFFTTEAPLGNACLNSLDEPFAVGQRIITIRPLMFNASFLLKAFLSNHIQNEIDKRKTGVTAKGIKSARLIEVPIPLPPLAEQNAIVERLDRLLESVNALEQHVSERKRYAKQLMQAVLKEAFAV